MFCVAVEGKTLCATRVHSVVVTLEICLREDSLCVRAPISLGRQHLTLYPWTNSN